MKLEDISAEIRPRNAWEAIDLGCVMTRRHYGDILRAWCATVVPMWVLILVGMHGQLFWAMAIIWWLKPVTERVPLFVLSRALFGDPLRWSDLWREWPRMVGRRVWGTLFWRRFSPVRTLVAPVVDLEDYGGQRLSRADFLLRKRAVCSGAGSGAFLLQIVVLLVLHSSWIGLLLFGFLMFPVRYRPEMEVLWAQWGEPDAVGPVVVRWAGIVLYLICLTLVTPFLVGGGFGLYLNSRTRLEGWDVELAFRRMANRLGQAAVLLCLAGFFTAVIAPRPAWCGEPVPAVAGKKPGETIAQVLQDRAFEIQKAKIFRLKERKPDKLPDFKLPHLQLPFLQGMGDLLGWFILGSLGLFLIYLAVRALVSLRGDSAVRTGKRHAPVKTVMGLNVEEEKLPADLVAAARDLWARGDAEGAMRLLYRGALSWLVNRGAVPIRESDTEVECLHRVRAQRRPEAVYFGDLTRMWIHAAYGRESAVEMDMERLFAGWPFEMGANGGGK